MISEKSQKTMIERYGEIYNKYTPKFNLNSTYYLDVFSEKLDIQIQHALNGGEKKFVRYYIDGYSPDYNICIEWAESHHNVKKFKENDRIKEQYLTENFDCTIIRIIEKEFLKNIVVGIDDVIIKINNIIKEKHGKSPQIQ